MSVYPLRDQARESKSSGEADIEQETAGYEGHVIRPEEVISKINQIFLHSSGKLPHRSLARRKYQKEVVSRFAHTQLCLAVKTTHLLVAEGEQKHLKYSGKSRPKCSGRNLRHALCRRKRTVSAEKQGGAATPTAREGEEVAGMSSQRQSTVYPQERPTSTTRELLDPSIASVLRDSTERTSHELLDLVTRSRV